MVKFSKQFEAQLVPEWKDAFVDYGQLKKDLKKIELLDSSKNNFNQKDNASLFKKKNSSFSNIMISAARRLSMFGQKHREHGPIQVHRKLAASDSRSDLYETELFEQFGDVEAANEFFVRLDLQINKVNQFRRKQG